jgi:ABC-type taurine transport system substrate-binding protein
MQVDWSRGGDAVIVKRGINTANDLKGKRIAVAVPSPAQTLTQQYTRSSRIEIFGCYKLSKRQTI